MWRKIENKAKELAQLVDLTIRSSPGRPFPSFECAIELADLLDAVSASNDENTATKLANIQKSLSPLRKYINVLKGAIAQGGPPHLPRDRLTALSSCLTAIMFNQFSEITKRHDTSFSAVSVTTLEALMESFWFLEPLARHLTAVPPPEANEDQISKVVLRVREAAQVLMIIFKEHPQGQRLAAAGKLRDGSLTAALWALAPTLSWDLGAGPAAKRGLAFSWVEAYFDIGVVSNTQKRLPPLDQRAFTPVLTAVIEEITAAVQGKDPEEMLRALNSMDKICGPLFGAVSLLLNEENSASKAFAKIASAAAPLQRLLRAVAELRVATTAPGIPADHSLFGARLIICSCSAAGAFLCEAAGPALADKVPVIFGPMAVQCLQNAVKGCSDVVHRANDSPEFFNFHTSMSGTPSAIYSLFLGFMCEPIRELLRSGDLNRAREQLCPHLTSLMAQGASCMAVAAATFPTLLSLTQASQTAAAARGDTGKFVNFNTIRALSFAGNNYAIAAQTTAVKRYFSGATGTQYFSGATGTHFFSGDELPDIDDAEMSKCVSQAVHSCCHAALVLLAAGPRLLDSTFSMLAVEEIAQWWCRSVLGLNKIIMIQTNFEDRKRAALHTLAMLASIPQSYVTSLVEVGTGFEGLVQMLTSQVAELRPVLVPEDAEGLKRVLHHGAQVRTAAVPALRELLEIAKRVEGLEQRQRQRLELLKGLPLGICANLRCAETPPAKLKTCSGCGIRYCSSKCQRYDWSHGHRVACKAVQREREA